MSHQLSPIVRSSLLLGLIALLGTALLSSIDHLTHDRILEQEQNRVLRQLNEIIPLHLYDNPLHEDVIEINDPEFFRHTDRVTVYRARSDSEAVALIMRLTAADGYNGDIRLLVGISAEGTIMGVRVLSHRETPGLGDPIESGKSDWIYGFEGTSMQNPGQRGWAVKKDGGEFDQFTGATISPRAVVTAVHRGLVYFDEHRQLLFNTKMNTTINDE
jgi:electron transport complex protein RnfG